MADREGNKWVWTAEEKRAAKAWQPRVRLFHEAANLVIARISATPPEVQNEARRIAERMGALSAPLLALSVQGSRRRKEAISPQEVEDKLRDFEAVVTEWMALLDRPEVRAAVDAHRRDLGAQREAGGRSPAVAVKGDPIPTLADQVTAALAVFVRLAVASPRAHEGASRDLAPEDWNILHRLALVHFVRTHYEYARASRRALEGYLTAHPSATMRDVLFHVLDSHIARGTEDGLVRSTPNERIGRIVEDVGTTLVHPVREKLSAGVVPRTLAAGYFTILGRDFSVATRPE